MRVFRLRSGERLMPCIPINFAPGITGVACTRGRRPAACHYCSTPHSHLCDWKIPGGTCDRKLCSRHTSKPKPGKDLCQEHARQWETMKTGR